MKNSRFRLAALAVTAALTVAVPFLPAASAGAAKDNTAGLRPEAIGANGTSFERLPKLQNRRSSQSNVQGRTSSTLNSKVQSVKPQAADVVTIQETGSVNERFNMVFVGEGYTSSQQDKFISDARRTWERVTQIEPFKAYRGAFNVYAVKAVSTKSGLSTSPEGSALGGTMPCDGVERLFCVDTEQALAFARNAPKTDQVFVVGNASMYGGAGYIEAGVATATADHPRAFEVAVHELGHSMGALDEEYSYTGETYTGNKEFALANATIDKSGKKWAHLLGKSTPDGGRIGTFEGGANYDRGVYRPSENSIMRNIGQPFNLVGLEAMIKGIKEKAPNFNPGGTPTTKPTVAPTTKPTVKPTPTVAPTEEPTDSPSEPGSNEFSNNTRVDIKDFKNVGTTINSTFAGAKSVTITLDITHSCKQNLDIFITTPDGVRNSVAKSTSTRYSCQDFGGKSVQTFRMNSKSDGAWKLEIIDRFRGNEGRLNGWSVSFS